MVTSSLPPSGPPARSNSAEAAQGGSPAGRFTPPGSANGKDAFHEEKAELLPAALEVSTYVQVDDTGARHQGHNGVCTHIGNDLFASFESTASKSRENFLEVLCGAHTDYTINDVAVTYWRRRVGKGGDRAVEGRCAR